MFCLSASIWNEFYRRRVQRYGQIHLRIFIGKFFYARNYPAGGNGNTPNAKIESVLVV